MILKVVLEKAVAEHIIKEKEANALYEFIQKEQAQGFNLTQVFYYFGAFLALSAMAIFLNKGWEAFGGWGIFGLSLGYLFFSLWLANTFQKKSLRTPAALSALLVISASALSIYGFQLGMGFWPDLGVYRDYHSGIKWNCFFLEIGTLMVSFFMAYRHRYAVMVIPIMMATWFLAIDLTALLYKTTPDFTLSVTASLFYGLFSMLVAFFINRRQPPTLDYAFWIYLLGTLSFWLGLSCQETHGEFSKFIYLGINLLMMGIGVILSRPIFIVLGALGCCLYIGHLSSQIFQNSVLFPLSLTFIGFMYVYLGILWQRNSTEITKIVRNLLQK